QDVEEEEEEEPLPTGKALKRLLAEEKKILRDPATTDEEREALLARREERNAKSSRVGAETRDANYHRRDVQEVMGFTENKNDMIEYGGQYYGAAIEIPPVEFRFFSPMRRNMSIEQGVGKVLRAVGATYSANIVKIERPVFYDDYLDNEYRKLEQVQHSYEAGVLSELELKARTEILYDRIHELRSMCYEDKVLVPHFYLVLFEADTRNLEIQISSALNDLRTGELDCHRLNDRELALFLRYSNELDFEEREIDLIEPENYAKWAQPAVVDITPRRVELNRIITHNFRVVGYPTVVGDAWLAGVFSMPGTKCVIKCTPMDRAKAIRAIDRSLEELRDRYRNTRVDSRRMELETHVQTLNELLSVLQQDNETLMQTNVYVTAYDIVATRKTPTIVQPEKSSLVRINNMKKAVRRLYQESGIRLNNMEFDQIHAFIGSQINGFDPCLADSRGIPTNTLAAAYPWIFANISDKNGVHLGDNDGVPVFIDFFRRDSERLNSNMVIVGKSGSGKSYATKSLLANLAADDSKIFILDPENEYAELASNLHGRFINVGNAQQGRLNPFHIITALEDDETGNSGGGSDSYSTHMQFLEEFFRQILPDCEKDALEYLNSLVDRMYRNKGITTETDLSKLKPSDYPVFDDLYDVILMEFQQTGNEYIRTMLRVLMNYIAKFSTGGRNSNIWNGPASVTTEENFIVFNFQSLLANRNMTIANAQMLLVLKYVDNEIIKNREYNRKYGLNRKIIVVIDEAHVFIDTKYPTALDFMFQLAKRIRKYNGMQIVITQNIKDFVGSEEIARKSTAIINACQYSFIFALAPNDMQDLCKLYEKAGGINEVEQEQIISAARGQAFTILGPNSRTSVKVETPEGIERIFSEMNCPSGYFNGEDGERTWEEVVGEHRARREENGFAFRKEAEETEEDADTGFSFVTMEELDPDEAAASTGVETILIEEEAAPPSRYADAIAPPVVPTAATGMGGETERLLCDLMGKFSFDAMRSEIRHTVRQEMEADLAAQRAELSALQQELQRTLTQRPSQQSAETEELPTRVTLPVEETTASELFTEQPEDAAASLEEAAVAAVVEPEEPESPSEETAMPETTEEPDFMDEEALPSEVSQDEEESEPPQERPEDPEEAASFDLNALLSQYSCRLEDFSPIDMMEVYGETCIDVTLEQLAQFNSKRK
ncbi:MAG: DUF87 domain-containing protein, partial [Oscillospiraceae bacterium]